MFRSLLLLAVLSLSYTKDIVKDCGPPDAYIKFHKLDIEPMPFNVLGKIKVIANVETTELVGDKVSLSVNLKKRNLNNAFTWEVPCTNIGLIGDDTQKFAGYIGSCDYKGSCDFPFIKTWTSKQTCPKAFAEYKLPCQCPFGKVTFNPGKAIEVDLEQFKDQMPTWLVEGGYEVKAVLKDTAAGNKVVGCIELDFDVNARKPCPAVLKRLNACP